MIKRVPSVSSVKDNNTTSFTLSKSPVADIRVGNSTSRPSSSLVDEQENQAHAKAIVAQPVDMLRIIPRNRPLPSAWRNTIFIDERIDQPAPNEYTVLKQKYSNTSDLPLICIDERLSTPTTAATTTNGALNSPLTFPRARPAGNPSPSSSDFQFNPELMLRAKRQRRCAIPKKLVNDYSLHKPNLICVCLLCLLFNTMGAVSALCESCRLNNLESYKLMRQEQILSELLMKLDLRWKPNVTVDYDNLPPIGRDNPRVRALFEASMREAGHRRVRKSTRSAISQSDNYSHVSTASVTASQLYDYDDLWQMDDSGYFPELYEPEERLPPSDITYIMATTPPTWFNQNNKVAFFSVSPAISNALLMQATLTVFVWRPPILDISTPLPMHISVYERYTNGTLGDKIAEKTLITHWTDDVDEIRHYELHLDENDVREWLKPASFRQQVTEESESSGEAFVGLYVQAVYDNKNYIVYPDEPSKNMMFLELEVRTVPSGRRRRSARQAVCKPGSNETSCCLYNLMIDFEKVGWDFVIAPKRYNAFICSGDCNDTPLDPSNKHDIVTQKHKESLRCCHPKEYGSITVVYITDSQLIWVREVPGMVAKRCGCA